MVPLPLLLSACFLWDRMQSLTGFLNQHLALMGLFFFFFFFIILFFFKFFYLKVFFILYTNHSFPSLLSSCSPSHLPATKKLLFLIMSEAHVLGTCVGDHRIALFSHFSSFCLCLLLGIELTSPDLSSMLFIC